MFLRLSHDSRVRLFLLLARGLEAGESAWEVAHRLREDEDPSLARLAPELEARLAAAKGSSSSAPLGSAMERMRGVFTAFQVHQVKRAEAGGALPAALRQLALGEEANFSWSLAHESKVRFFRELAMALTAGLPYARILQIMSQDHQEDFSRVARALERRVTLDGRPVSAAMGVMKQIFSTFQIEMVAVGERAGGLSEVLTALADEEEHSYRLRKKVRATLIVPGFTLALVGFLLIVGLPLVVFRAYLELIEGMNLPQEGLFAWLVSFMRLTQTPAWWGSLSAVALLVLVVFRSAGLREQFMRSLLRALSSLPGAPESLREMYAKGRNWEGLLAFFEACLHSQRIRPVKALWQMWVSLLSARFAYALGMQLNAGVPMNQALGAAIEVTGSPWWSSHRRKVVSALETGDLGQTLQELPGCPPMLVSMVEVGSEVGSLPLLCEKTAQLFRDDFEHNLDVASKLLEPFVFLILGGVVGLFVVMMLMPMAKVMESL